MKNLFFIVGFILFINAAFSQTSVVVSEQRDSVVTTKSLIKEYRYPSTITCIRSEDRSSTFIYSDQAMFTQEITVPNLEVNDMIILKKGNDLRNDTVFFCGRDLRTGLATFGFFNIYNAFNGVDPVYLHDPFLSGPGAAKVSELTRMVSFSDGENMHFVCIGKDETDFPCLVEVIVGPAPSVWYYRTGTVMNTMETLYDVKIVYSLPHDYLVTAGMDYDYSKRYLNLRVYDLGDIFAPSGIQETKHVFCIDTVFGIPWEKDDVLLRQNKEGYFTTVSYLKPELYINNTTTPGPGQYLNSLHIGVFNMSLLLSGSLSSMVKSAVFKPVNYIDNTLTWLVKGPGLSLAFQEKIMNSLGTEASNFWEFDFNSSFDFSAVEKFNSQGDIYYGLDAYNFHNNYVMSGFENGHRTTLKYCMETFSSSKTCYVINKFNYIYYNPYRSVNNKKGFDIRSKNCTFKSIEVEPILYSLDFECVK